MKMLPNIDFEKKMGMIKDEMWEKCPKNVLRYY